MKKFGAQKTPLLHLKVFSSSILARRIPLSIWYFGSRFILYDKKTVQKKVILLGTIIETLLTGLSGIILLVILYFLNNQTFSIIYLSLLALFLLLILGKPNSIINLTNKLLIKFKKTIIIEKVNLIDWVKWLSLYFLSWLFAALTFYFCLVMITNYTDSLLSAMIISNISGLIGYISMIFPAGLGLKEIGTGILFQNEFPFSIGLIIGIVYRVLTTIIEIVWALFSAIISDSLIKTSNNP
jgi:uncharacterized membrane protein YbhN (UPF0104 family)